MPAPISPADKAAFIAGWAAVRTAFNKVSSLGRGVPEVGALANAVAAIDSAIPGWRAGTIPDATFARMYRAIGDAAIGVGNASRRLQSYGLADAINEFQAQADNLNGYLMDYWDAGAPTTRSSQMMLIASIGIAAALAVGIVVMARK